MATDRELSLKVSDFMGVNQQVDREDISNYQQWRNQNLWEKKIGVLETRGGSNSFASGFPSNVTALDNTIRLFKNTLDHKRLISLAATEDTPATRTQSLPAGVTLSWITGGTDHDGIASSWNKNITADVSTTPKGIVLRFCGFGYDKYYIQSDATLITGYSAGVASRLRVAIASPLANANISCIEVYGVIACGGATYDTNQSAIWAGSIDLVSATTGNFDFYHAPLSKRSSSVSASGSNGSLAAAYTVASEYQAGGTLLPNKTYYVAVLPHNFAWSATAELCQNQYRQFGGGGTGLGLENIAQVTIGNGENSIAVKYPPSSATPISFNSMLVCIGESPELMIPYELSNVNPGSPNSDLIKNILTFPQNTPAVVDIEYLEEVNSLKICNLRFRQSDFSTYDSLCRIKDDGTKVPVFIARQSTVNRYDNYGAPLEALTVRVAISSSGGSGPTIVVSPDLTATPYFTDPLPVNTPVTFSFAGGGSIPGNITAGVTYYWAQDGNTGGVWTVQDGSPSNLVAYSSAGLNVQMNFADPRGFLNSFPAVSGAGPSLYTGSYNLIQTLMGQKFNFQAYRGLGFFVTGISNAPITTLVGNDNKPVSGTNYYVTDGNVAALVVFEFSTNLQPPPYSSVIGLYQESILLSGLGDTVTFSNATNPFNFEVATTPGLNQFFQVEGLGEWVTGFSVFSYSMVYVSPQSFLVVTKKNSSWILENLPTTFGAQTFLVQISKAVGTPSGPTLVQTPIGVLFAAVDNVYMVKGGGDPVPIADPISFILKQSDLSRAVASYHDEQYKLSFYSSLYSGSSSYNNVEFWLDIKKMKQAEGKPDWKGPMIGRQIDAVEVENLTGDGIVYNLTRDRVCIDRQNVRVFKADVLPAPTDTVINDFATPVTSLFETKDYQVQKQDDNWLKLFTRTLWKVRTNLLTGGPLSTTITTYVDGVLQDTKTVTFAGLAATNFDDQPQVYTMEFPTGRYRGRTIRKILSTTQRIGIAGFELYYQIERRRIGS